MADEDNSVVEIPVEEKPDAPVKNTATEDEIAALKAQVQSQAEATAAANERAEAESRRADTAQTVVQDETSKRFYAQDVALANFLSSAQNDIIAAKAKAAQLASEGNWAGSTEAQAEMFAAQLRESEGKRQKEYIDRQKAQWKAQSEQAQREAAERAQQPQQQQYHPRAQAWIEAHPLFNTDATYHNRVLAAHHDAIAEGNTEFSDGYFQHMEEKLGERTAVDTGSESAPVRQRSVTTAIAPSRTTPSARAEQKRITLSPQERETADFTMAHIKDPAQRYRKYAENRERMNRDNPLVIQ